MPEKVAPTGLQEGGQTVREGLDRGKSLW